MKSEKEFDRFSIRFYKQSKYHKAAREKLLKIPRGERNEYCVMSVYNNPSEHPLEQLVRLVIKEELRQAVEEMTKSIVKNLQEITIESQISKKIMQEQNKEDENKRTGKIPSVALDFLAGL